jgi:ribosomal protein S18 acetylase RimI-like enzyme
MAVRVATDEDFMGVHDIFLEVHKFHMDHTDNVFKDIDPISEDEFKEMLSIPETIFLVSDNDGIDGFLNANIIEKNSKFTGYKKYLMIEQLGVTKNSQKNGVGRSLMDLAEKIAKEKGCTMLVLDVWGFNENAIGFYEHLGFAERTRKLQKFI